MVPEPGSVLLDSSLTGSARLFARPRDVVTLWPGEPDVEAAFRRLQAAHHEGLWLAGFAAYELGYLLEPRLAPLLPAKAAAMAGPLLSFGLYDSPAPAAEAQALLARCDAGAGRATLERVVPALGPAAYGERFRQVADWILAGDVYQANLTFPLAIETRADPLALYGALRRAQPVRHGALVALAGPLLLSASPELFFRADAEGWIETRPMKGTAERPAAIRGDAAAERAARAALAADPKNRAENLMIVDLLRNDIGRTAEIGSVSVPSLFEVETYETLYQMVSTVRGRLKAGGSLLERFRALFPCGSVTGAPKIRAMEIIAELEESPREAYCGAIGCIAPGGAMAFSVAIRTLRLGAVDGAGEVGGGGLRRGLLSVGSGLVADSGAAEEYAECLLKARFLTDLLRSASAATAAPCPAFG
ncbi:aminodeoxychorismate synthase, subunit I [Tistlia consotensis]|uniref:Aminodeoxychorismate synthase, subunit I n=1 Tax=Tistlia consotensis USBA 355 TaxID=560819 RepID=A0A1Y6CBC4_9PROT|nr:aminodeoxychorismate synthase component I [Tistlia consotensis]SMF53301.1 aminodeoxychorismate synthase, subunit I [Tistlia consotensis USBA 355]SNR85349.1 aminodeoxychorismate synthase, subunit I [Tistlia consotensis]